MAFGGSLVAQTAVPELAFDANADLLKTPNDISVGEVAGVGTTSKGQIFVYTRTGHSYATIGDNRTFFRGGSRLFQFDQTGKFVRELGQDVYGFNAAIGLRVDPQDNVWTIDAARQPGREVRPGRPRRAGAGQKAGSDRGPAGAAGRARRSGRSRPRRRWWCGGEAGGGGGGGGQNRPPARAAGLRHAGLELQPSRPTSPGTRPATSTSPTASAPTTASPSSTKKASFSRTGDRPARGRASSPACKALAIDTPGNVYVADAGNKRIEVFDAEGTFKSEFANVGTPVAMCMTRGATQFSTSRTPPTTPAWTRRRSTRCSSTARSSAVRRGREAAEAVRHRQLDRLPQRERAAGRRDDELARAEGHVQEVGGGRRVGAFFVLFAPRALGFLA